jgi:hypothetical protein
MALNNLALAATNNTAILQQLTAANLALTTAVSTLTATNKKLVDAAARAKGATNKKLVDAAARAKGGGTPAVTPKKSERGVQATRTPFPSNYCWTHGNCCNKHHTSATCDNKAMGHHNDATAANTMGHSWAAAQGTKAGTERAPDGWDGEFSLL